MAVEKISHVVRLAAALTLCAVLSHAAALSVPWSPAQGVTDAQGNLYVVGYVTSNSVPVTPGAFQTQFHSATCSYIDVSAGGVTTEQPVACRHLYAAKLSPDGSTVLWATYIEGSQDDINGPYTVDAAGHLFISGTTSSPDFPVTGALSGLPPPSSITSPCFFLLELAADGSQLIFSHTFGPQDGIFTISAVVLDSQGGLYVAGDADGTVFPTTPSAYMHDHSPASTDVFVFKLDIASDSIVYSTLFGGSGEEVLVGFTIDSADNLYFSGYTVSTDLPVTPGSYQAPGPLINIFVAKLSSGGSSLVFSSIFAGSRATYLGPITTDVQGNVYIAGADCCGVLEATPGAFQSAASGGISYAAKFDATTGALIFLTYLADGNASGSNEGFIAAASDGSVWISQATEGIGFNRPLIMSPDALNPCGPSGTYVKHISADGTEQLYGTFLANIVGLSGNGTVRTYNPVSGFQTIDLTAPQPPQVTCIVNAASFTGQAIAPGEIITIFGPDIGPDQPQSYQLTSSGTVSTSLGGLQVLIGGLPAPILYASKNQINAVVPFAAPTQGSVTVAVDFAGVSIAPVITTAVASAPGIFSVNGTGTGQGAIFNADGSLNTPANPAAPGSFVSIYVTGLGPMSPLPVDGSIPQTPYAKPTLPIQVFGSVGGGNFDVEYAGDAPGMVEGIQQIKIALPAGGSNASVTSYQVDILAGTNSNPASNQMLVSFN
jgi:uncharacterized protein (TIGR03437 family)